VRRGASLPTTQHPVNTAASARTALEAVGTVGLVGLRRVAPIAVAAVSLAACSSSSATGESASVSTVPEEYRDSITRTLDRLASERRPAEPSAIPPRHLDEDTFPVSLVDRDSIVYGGAPPDGISPIDEPTYEPVGTVDWLDADEAVFVVELDGVTRIYPVQIMIWHEIVNDVIGDRPVSVTYCPLCNSGLAFDRRVGDDVLDFGTSGALHQANLVMYDRQTESLWTQFDGRAVVGTRVGDVLDTIPMTMVAWDDARGRYPDATVVARSVTDPKPYGRNPYNAYDQRTSAIPGFYRGEPDGSLAPYERVVGVERGGDAVAVAHRGLVGEGTAAITVGGSHVTVWHRAGMASPLNDPDVADGAAIGSTRAYLAEVRGEPTEFRRIGEGFVDAATQSTWNFFGEAIAGPATGDRLRPVVHVDTFWFAWATFHVDTRLVEPS
jgi:hypothetical protein